MKTLKPRNEFARALATPLYKQRRVESDRNKKTHQVREEKKLHELDEVKILSDKLE